MAHRAKRPPSQLSGGQQQRVAVAARLRADRRFCLRTSRPVTSIRTTAKRSCICFANSIRAALRFAWLPTTSVSPSMRIAQCTCLMVASSRTAWLHKTQTLKRSENADASPRSSLRTPDASAQSRIFNPCRALPHARHRDKRRGAQLDRRNSDSAVSARATSGSDVRAYWHNARRTRTQRTLLSGLRRFRKKLHAV